MNIRRILATTVAAAVTTPVVLLSAAPAFADTKPAEQTRNQTQNKTQNKKKTIEQLRLEVTAAQKAYDAAVVAEAEAQKTLDALLKSLENGGTHPLAVAYTEAKAAAEKADTDKKTADQAVLDAQAKVDAATTDEEKAAAEKILDEAKKAAETAAATKTTADADAAKARTAVEDARVDGVRELSKAQKAKTEAGTALDAAKKALADAEEEAEEGGEECVDESTFVTVLTGPKKVVAGTTADYSLKITNGTGKVLDQAGAYAFVTGFNADTFKDLDRYLDLKWSSAASPKWRSVDEEEGIDLGRLNPGARADIKLKLTVDATSPAGRGLMFAVSGYDGEDGSCGLSQESVLEFDIAAKSKKPLPDSSGGNTGTTGQGGTSSTPVTTTGTTGTTGSLAKTGSGDAVPQIALAGGAAVVLGAGAMFVVRRRKADSRA
ncbi:LPXTG cell wall anchor domain-containing protein [Streptomyces sp. NPDC048577]|uniref:LPXTG cell wall anchor domain-containing protein n=1 Tax=Streptomyces sp. NPDC048577 TaxID=3157209 RepID=UPI00343FAE9E